MTDRSSSSTSFAGDTASDELWRRFPSLLREGTVGAEQLADAVLDAIGYDALVVERDHWKRERDRYRDGLVEIAGRDHWDTRHGEAQTIAYRALDDGVRVPLAEGDEASHQ